MLGEAFRAVMTAESMYSSFRIQPPESRSRGIVRPIMTAQPFAWAFFAPLIIITSFAVLNPFIALIVNPMQTVHEHSRDDAAAEAKFAREEQEVPAGQIARPAAGIRESGRELWRRH